MKCGSFLFLGFKYTTGRGRVLERQTCDIEIVLGCAFRKRNIKHNTREAQTDTGDRRHAGFPFSVRASDGSVRKPQTPFVFIDTNTNFCAQNPFHNLFVCVFEHKLEDFVGRSDAAYQSFRATQTQRYV
jgi:hypothetical protein